ncbi:MAG: septal ring lytic transglycosylase RlpA family protein [Spirochaetales bacterium]|nr:septal ring lytic transglycosylase RlpA family protein [Spirochaetales bacterium]
MAFRRLFSVLVLVLLLAAAVLSAYEQEGLASWYGGKFQGRQTASGEIFDTNRFTAAHKSLAFGTVVRVTNLENDRSTIVRINDRGPFIPGRIIDLSRAAAAAIGLAGKGVVRVRIEVLPPDSPEAAGILAGRTPVTYSIQVAAYRSRQNAERTLKRLQEQGFEGALEAGAEGIYRVVVPEVAEAELQAVRGRLLEAGWADVVARRRE